MYCPFSYVLEECRSEKENGKPMCAYCLTFSIYSDTHPGAKYINHNLRIEPDSKRPRMDIEPSNINTNTLSAFRIAICCQMQNSIKKERAHSGIANSFD